MKSDIIIGSTLLICLFAYQSTISLGTVKCLAGATNEDSCQLVTEKRIIGQVSRWSHKFVKHQDRKRRSKYWEPFNTTTNHLDILGDHDKLRDQFYKMTAQSLQSVCHVVKNIAGTWTDFKGDKCMYGEKLLCMDGIYKSIMKKECLVYSFGLGKSLNKVL